MTRLLKLLFLAIVGLFAYQYHYLAMVVAVSIAWYITKQVKSLGGSIFLLIKFFFIISVSEAIFDTFLHYINYSIPLTLLIYKNAFFFLITLLLLSISPSIKEIGIFLFNIFDLALFWVIKKVKITKRLKADKTLIDIDKLGNNGLDFEDFISSSMSWLHHAKSFTTRELRDDKNLPLSILNSAGSGEQGVDVIVLFNKLTDIGGDMVGGLAIQAKHYSNTVGNKAVQEIFSAIPMYEDHFEKKLKPMVITNNYFTKSALTLADSNNVTLIDRDNLPLLLKQAQAGVLS